MYGPMSKPENKPLTKLLGPFFKDKWSEKNRKKVFKLGFFGKGGPFGHPKSTKKGPQRFVSGWDE
jgi:hypothetical protein